jgi:hypothetical protein
VKINGSKENMKDSLGPQKKSIQKKFFFVGFEREFSFFSFILVFIYF